MTKIKKSIWSAVVCVVMSLALVFGVFAGVRSNNVAKAEYDQNARNEFQRIIQDLFNYYGANPTSDILTDTEAKDYHLGTNEQPNNISWTGLQAYKRALECYSLLETNSSADFENDGFVGYQREIFENYRKLIEPLKILIQDIVGTEVFYVPSQGKTQKFYGQDRVVEIGYDEILTQSYVDEYEVDVTDYVKHTPLGYMLNRTDKYYNCQAYRDPYDITITVQPHETGVIYSDAKDYYLINARFVSYTGATLQTVRNITGATADELNALLLDAKEQEFVRQFTDRIRNVFEVGGTVDEILKLQREVKNESLALEQLIDETDVLYSYKADYDAVKAKHDSLDPSAQAEANVALAYGAIAELGDVFADIEAKTSAAKTAIDSMLYYLEGDMVANPQGLVVVDTEQSYLAVAEALNAIYDGRQVGNFKVAEFESFEAVDSDERAALATYLGELNNYYAAGEIIDGYHTEAEGVEAQILPLEVTAQNHYKLLEGDINNVYAAYAALNTPYYNGHNNRQTYIAEANRTKIEGYKTTLDALNAWIREVAELVDARNDLGNLELTDNSSVADVDAVIAWALENDFLFNVNDKATVDALVESYEVLADDEAKVNSLHDAREVLRVLKDKIDEAIALEEAKVEELKGLLNTMGELLADGVKYADRVVYDHFTEVYVTLSDVSQAELQAQENWENYPALGEALDVIAARALAVGQLIDGIVYRHGDGVTAEYTVDTNEVDGEIVVYSKASVEAAQAAVNALYNGDSFTYENEDNNKQVEYKLASLAYPWAEDVVGEGDESENAFVHYFDQVDMQAYYDKYDAAVEDLDALKAEAQAVEDSIESLVITNYRAQRADIEGFYAQYQALNRGNYNDLREWVDNGQNIVDAHNVLVTLDGWVRNVAMAIDIADDPAPRQMTFGEVEGVYHPTIEEVDEFINNTTVDDVKLTLTQINMFLGIYDTITDYDAEENTRDDVKAVSVKEAHDLLVERAQALNDEKDELQNDINDLADILINGVKYADKATYDDLVQRLAHVDPQLVGDVETGKLEALGEALNEIKDAVNELKTALSNIVYRHGDGVTVEYTKDTNAEDGEIVVDSKESVENATLKVESIYDGRDGQTQAQVAYKIADLEYPWAEDVVGEVPALVHYGLLTEADYAKYEAAVTDLNALKTEASNYQTRVDAFELTKANNYKVQEETIEQLYDDYQGLNHGLYNNVQEWVNAVKVTEAKQVLDLLNGWIADVAEAIDADLTEQDGADAVIAAAKAGDVQVNLTLQQVNDLLEAYDEVTDGDEIKEESVKDAYGLLVARKEVIDDATDELQDELDELEELLADGVKYSDREKYEELLQRANELEALGAELDTSNLEAVGDALEEIEERTNALKTAINNIEYYLNGEMVKDPAGEVVYDTKESLDEATAKVEAVYDGTEHIAALEFPWGETEEAALARWSEDTGIEAEDLAKYKAALAEFNRLWDIEKTVATRIDELNFTVENHFKLQEDVVNLLLADTVHLYHEAEVINGFLNEGSVETYNWHNDWTKELGEEKYMKILGAYLTVNAINDFDLEVAQLVDETLTAENATVEGVDALLLETIANGFGDRVAFNPRKVVAKLDYYADWIDVTENYKEALVKSLEPAKTVLDMMYNRAKTLNNTLVADVLDIINRKDSLVETDYNKIMSVRDTYEQLSNLQKAIFENNSEYTDEEDYSVNPEYYYELGWETIYPHTIDEFLELTNKFEFALYFKQAVDELVNELNTTYFTVEGYVLEKALLSMYCNFDPSMQAMVTSSYQNLLRIDAAYKEMSRDEYTSYTTVTDDLEGQIEDAKTELETAQAALEEAQGELIAEIKTALGEENAESVQEALENYKAAVEQAQADLEAAKEALAASITNSLDPEAESVEEAFENYKAAVAQAQEDLEAAQEELVAEIKTALGDEEAESVQEALSNYKASVEEAQEEQAQTQAQAAKAAEDGNKENDEKVASLKKALIITAVVGGVVAVAAVACIVVLFTKMAALGGAGAAAGSSAAGSSAAAEGGKDEE